MKILKITLQGINSIKDKYEIDLSCPQYSTQGIFAIVGTTGAGKSTLLDAICLAIYGRTPRLETISENNNELMNKDSAECLAEVLLQINTDVYSFYFAQHRAGKSTKGKLQKQRREIRQFIDGDFRVISNKSSQVNHIAKEILTMDFNQFTRSVLLSQGSFSLFLKSENHERSALLERITGTQIYAKISQQVFMTHKLKYQELKEIQAQQSNIHLLSDEELSIIKKTIDDKNKQKHTLSQNLQKLQYTYNKKVEFDDIIIKKQHINQEIVDIQQKIQAFLEQTDKLKYAINANKIKPLYELSCHQKKQIKDMADNIAKLNNQKNTQHQKLNEQQIQCRQMQDKKHAFDDEFIIQSQNLKIAKTLEDDIKSHTIQLSHHQDNHTQKINEQKSIQTSLTKLINDNTLHKQAIDTLHQQTIKLHSIVPYSQEDKFDSDINKPFYKQLIAMQNIKALFDQNGINEQLANLYRHHQHIITCHQQKQALHNTINSSQQLFITYQNDIHNKFNHLTNCLDLFFDVLDDGFFDDNVKTITTDDIHDHAINTSTINNYLGKLNHCRQSLHDKKNVIFFISHQLENIQSIYHNYWQKQHDHQLLQKQITNNQHELSSLANQLIVVQSEIEQSQKTLLLNDNAIKIAEQNSLLQTHLHKLQDDMPCPLCGSTTHPNKHNNDFVDIDRHISSLKDEQKIKQSHHQKLTDDFNKYNHAHIRLSQIIQSDHDKYHLDKKALADIVLSINHKISELVNHKTANIGLLLNKYDIHIDMDNTDIDNIPIIKNNITNMQATLNQTNHQLDEMIDYLDKKIELIVDIINSIADHQKEYDSINHTIHIHQNNYNQTVNTINQLIDKLNSQYKNTLPILQKITTVFWSTADLFDDKDVNNSSHNTNHFRDMFTNLSQDYKKIQHTHIMLLLNDNTNGSHHNIDQITANFMQNKQILCALQQHYRPFCDDENIENINTIYNTLKNSKEQYNQYLIEINNNNALIENNQTAMNINHTLINQLTVDIDNLTDKITQSRQQIDQLTSQKVALIGTISSDDFERYLSAKQQIIYQDHQNSQQLLQNMDYELKITQSSLNHNQKQHDDLMTLYRQNLAQLHNKLREYQFKDLSDFLDKQLTDNQINDIQNEQTANNQQLATLQGQKNQIDQHILQLHADIADIEHLDKQVINTQIESNKQLYDNICQSLYELTQNLATHYQNKENKQAYLTKLTAMQDEFVILDQLNHLIGSSDGKKYRNIVQALTLTYILKYANHALSIISDRYTLTNILPSHTANNTAKKPDNKPDEHVSYSLDVHVIDNYQANSIRPSATLSGGETFLVSLALALGLSSIQSQQLKIESLFLDEGFGTLDEETLEMAMNALNELKQTGKMIGIISHVDSLKQRIGTHIEVIKVGGGVSAIKGVGVSKVS